MSTPQHGFTTLSDDAVDVRRYLDALRRGAWLIASIAVVVTVAVVAISESLPKTYTASARLIYSPTSSVIAGTNAESTQRQLATFESLVRAPTVIASAAKQLSEPAPALKDAISASADSSANILTISAEARTPSRAAARANEVARAFVAEEQRLQNSGYQTARTQLEAEVARLKATPNGAAQIAALESRISALAISSTGTASELQFAEAAAAPTGPSSPRVAIDALIALIVALLLGVFIALALDQLRPRFANPRELGSALGVPVLAGIPYRPGAGTARRRRVLAGLEHEAYNLLRTSVRVLDTPGSGTRVLLVTSATHGEGKTTVTASLGRSLARGGLKTLVVSGDMRLPTLHQHFGLPLEPGLSDCLAAAQHDMPDSETIESVIRTAPDERGLDVLVAGEMPSDPSSLAWGPALGRVVKALREMDYDYILLDTPPILGIADAQLLARFADDLLLVARLDRISPYQAEELAGLLARLELTPVGLAVVGARVQLAPYPYYVNEQTPVSLSP